MPPDANDELSARSRAWMSRGGDPAVDSVHATGEARANAARARERWRACDGRSAYASLVPTTRYKHLVLILARELVSNLATPTAIADDQGTLVFYNEAAESVVGRPFSEVGEMPMDEWTATFNPRALDSADPLPADRRPARIALAERRPSHERFLITSADGVDRELAVTAIPLFAHADELVGVMAVFWRN